MSTNSRKTESVFCPECGHRFELKEYEPVWCFSKEGQDIQNALDVIAFWRKINNMVVVTILAIVFLFLALIDINSFSGIIRPVREIGALASLVIRVLGIFYLYTLEKRLFNSIMKKLHPVAFNL